MIQCQLKLILRPTQERRLVRWLWHLTGVYNWALRIIELDAKDGIYRSSYDLEARLVGHSVKLGVPARVLASTARIAHQSWQRCFRRVSRRPHRKSNRNRLNHILIREPFRRPDGRHISIPTFGLVKFHAQVVPEGRIEACP